VPHIYVGRAAWNLARRQQSHFPDAGSHLERYAGRFPAVEINSSFYRPHQPKTYARWAACVPADFRFSAKIPKAITHELRLVGAEPLLDKFLAEVTALGEKLGCLLVQLPPSLAFDASVASSFFESMRARYSGGLVFEPRHPTWFTDDVERMLVDLRIGRVAADPPCGPVATEPGGWPGIIYYRLHGSPRIYYSNYEDAYLDALAPKLIAHAGSGVPVWCIFDNTALDCATVNALGLLERLAARRPEQPRIGSVG
jgi:uncharacterized protein YecE (DUF72 family)